MKDFPFSSEQLNVAESLMQVDSVYLTFMPIFLHIYLGLIRETFNLK